MTDFTLKLQIWPEAVDVNALELAAGAYKLARDLHVAERDWGPYRLADWAKDRGIKLYWVHSAWVRAMVTHEQAGEFLAGIGDTETLAPPATGTRYVIQAEEF